MKHWVLKLALSLFFVMFVSACSTPGMKSGVDRQTMEKELAKFVLPNTQKQGMALVYFIYRNDLKSFGTILGLNPEVEIFVASSSEDKVSKSNSQAFALANIVALGMLHDTPNSAKKYLANIKPGQFLSLNLKPGLYEFTRELTSNKNKLGGARPLHMELLANKTHFVVLKPSSFLNRYSAEMQHGIYMNTARDELDGRYILMKNFDEAKIKAM